MSIINLCCDQDLLQYQPIFDPRYATTNNVCGYQLYDKPLFYLHIDAYQKLLLASKYAYNLNLRLKIFDTYRPLSVQQQMFEHFNTPNYAGFVSNPNGGSIPHCRGVAIDLTLTNKEGIELDMGTDFDDFSELAYHRCNKISLESQKNRLLLLGIMTLAGFDFYSKEWWHYQLFNPRSYDIIPFNM